MLNDSSQNELAKKYILKLNKAEIIDFFIDYIQKEKPPKMKVPISIFRVRQLSALELIVKYMKENLRLTNIKISELLNRTPQTVWTTYENSRKKYSKPLPIEPSSYDIPVDIFKKRKLSTLETIASYLKEGFELNLHNIAILLNKDDRTIWTVCNRARMKK